MASETPPREGVTLDRPLPNLREWALAMLEGRTDSRATLSAADQAALRELGSRQIELELQNDMLRQAQAMLAASRDRYADLYDLAPTGYVILNDNGLIREANLTAAALLGVEREALLGRAFRDFVAASSQEVLSQHLARSEVSAAGQLVEVELASEHAPGRWVQLHSAGSQNLAEGAPELRIALVDISAQRETERLLTVNQELQRQLAQHMDEAHASAQHLAAIVASVMDAIVSTDAEQRIVVFNATAERVFGWKARDIIGQNLERIIPGGLDTTAQVQFRQLARKANAVRWPQPATVIGRRADGSTFAAEASVAEVHVGGSNLFTVILRDITERLQAQEKLRRSEEMLADLFLTAPIGLMWVGPDGRVLRVNQAQLEILGRPEYEVVGRMAADLYVDPENVTVILERMAEAKMVRNGHLTVCTRDGQLRYLLVNANGLWENGSLVHSRWFVRDITERRLLESEILVIAEKERARIGSELHDDVCQRLIAIEFMHGALIAKWGAAAPEAARMTEEISVQLREAAEHTRELARGLTPHIHIEADGLPTALQDLAERTQGIFQRVCRYLGPSTPVRLKTETIGLHLFRVAQESVGNAIKHSRASEIVIRLTVNETDVILGIEDNGVGISTAPDRRQGAGLRIMQYRTGLIGGSLAVQRLPTGGTAVVCMVRNVLVGPTRP